MKKLLYLLFFFIIISFGIASSQDESDSLSSNELILGDNELIILFSIAIAIVIGIFLYLARFSILRKKGEYEKGDFESKKDKTYEKYHSDWTSDENDFDKIFDKNFDKEYFIKFGNKDSFPNFYNILGLEKYATQDEIKRKFRELVKEWHPDKSKQKNSEEKMAQINMAYEVLSDKKRRKKYDRYLDIL